MAWGYAPPLMVEAALHLHVFELLDGGPKPASQIAEVAGASPRGVRILLDALVGLQLLAKQGENYALTPESSAFLVPGKPGFQGGIFKHVSTQLMPKWLELTEIVRRGGPGRAVNQHGEGAKFFAEFVEDIFPMSYPAARALGGILNLAEATETVRVLDIAAGSGVWGIALAETSPQVRVSAVDWPEVLPVTRRIAARHGVGDRFDFIEGDLRTVDFGTGYQVATLGHILHSEGETHSRALIQKVFNALAPGGTIAIAEMIPNDERTGPAHAVMFAVNMLVNTDEGDTFTFAEMSAWLREAGFVNPRLVDAPSASPLLLAGKPE